MSRKSYEDVTQFHGHSCPGLAMGYRMTQAALSHLEGKRSQDEELVAIVENDACGVDAVQYMAGCTFGKGNLIFKDYGKHVYTFYDRNTRKGVRVIFKVQKLPESLRAEREKLVKWILSEPDENVIELREVEIKEPERARIMKSVLCDFCGEAVMQTRTVQIEGKTACIPCANRIQGERSSQQEVSS